MQETIQHIKLDLLEPSPRNRTIGGFDQEKLEQLAESIKAVGVQQPAVVRKIREKYQIVAGERRWRASRIAGNDTLPCIVRDIDDVTALKIQYIENLQRDDVHPLDEADGYEQLVAQAGYTVEVLASEVGKSASYVYQRMKLSSLAPEARELFVKNEITAGHAILLARLTPELQREIIKEGLWGYSGDLISVRDLSDHIHNEIMLDMSRITWKINDPELLPEAGSCQDCPKRTGYQPALFADVCKNGKKDYCTDGACFSRKQQRVVEIKQAALEGQEYVMVVDSYVSSGDVPRGAVMHYQWDECKKSDPGAQRVLVVAGEKPGRMTWGKVRPQHNAPSKREVAYKEEQKKEQEKARKVTVERRDLVSKILDAVPLNGGLHVEALRVCVDKMWDEWDYESRLEVARVRGWIDKNREDAAAEGTKKIKSMSEAQLCNLLLHIVMANEVHASPHYISKPEAIDALAKIYGVKAVKERKAG